jgi:hypothetical protein
MDLTDRALLYVDHWRRKFLRLLATSADSALASPSRCSCWCSCSARRRAALRSSARRDEGQHAGEFLLEERMETGRPSRENITVLSGQNLKAGAVIGRVTLGRRARSRPAVVGTGNGTISRCSLGPEVQVGNYVLTCTAAANGGTFS